MDNQFLVHEGSYRPSMACLWLSGDGLLFAALEFLEFALRVFDRVTAIRKFSALKWFSVAVDHIAHIATVLVITDFVLIHGDPPIPTGPAGSWRG